MVHELLVTLLLVAAGALCWGYEEHITIVDPQRDHIEVDAGDNFTLVCEGKVPVKWIYPAHNTTEEQDYASEIHITTENREHPEPSYISQFHHIGAHYLDTGFYSCVAESGSDNSVHIAAKVYVYVKDVENLLSVRDSFIVQISILHQEAVIPCRPTFPAVTVNLQFNDQTSTEENDVETRYDPTEGFIIHDVDYENIGIYYCTASYGEETTTVIVFLDVLIPSTEVAKPTISGGPMLQAPVGGNVTLSCTLVERPLLLFHMDWEVPETTAKENRILLEDSASTYGSADGSGVMNKIGVRNLTILNVQPEDQGDYVCRVTDHANNTNQETIHVTVLES